MATSSLFLLASYLYNSKLSEGCGDWLHELNFAEHLEPVQRDGVKLVQRDDVLRVLIVHVNLAAHPFVATSWFCLAPPWPFVWPVFVLRIVTVYLLCFSGYFRAVLPCLW